MLPLTVQLVVLVALAGPFDAPRSYNTAKTRGPAVRAGGKEFTITHCMVLLADEVDVSAEAAGKLIEMSVQEGDFIRENDLVARLDDAQSLIAKIAAERELSAARVRAQDDIEVRFSKASFDVAEQELQQSLEIKKRAPGSIPISEIRRLKLTLRRAELQIDRSQLEMNIAAMTAEVREAELAATETEIARRQVASPISGVVLDVIRHRGEWVSAGDPIMRIVRMDTLHVEGFVDASKYDPGEVDGRNVSVVVELTRGRKAEFRGRVILVNPKQQAGGRYRIRAEVGNRQENKHWLLRPGVNAEMRIELR